MASRLLLALGASTMTVAAVAVSAPVLARADDGAAKTADYVAKAERELARDKTERAVGYAERAVEASNASLDARAMLARAYLADGRLNSAESAYRDLLVLTPGDPTATLNLALIRASLGDGAGARTLLMAADGLSEADRGLGLVLAGDVPGGGAVLAAAARSASADGRVRQNLAFAYAMAGDWRQARVVASQDLPPAAVHNRIGEWAKIARPRNSWDQVAYLLNIQPVEDEGMPAALALRTQTAAPVQLAVVPERTEFSEALASYAEPKGVESLAPPPVPAAWSVALPGPDAWVAPAAQLAPIIRAVAVMQPVPAPRPVVARAAPTPIKPIPASITVRPPSSRYAPGGRYVVQLGAYVTPGAAERGWAKAARHSDLSAVAAVTSKITVGGRHLTRVSAGNFASRGDATALCRSVKSHGGECFVREVKGDVAPRWASRAKDALALR